MIGRTLFSVTHRLRKSRALDVLAEIRGEAALPAEEVLARQWARLQGMLQHAESKVPYSRHATSARRPTSRPFPCSPRT
jgi:hypothetical protein